VTHNRQKKNNSEGGITLKLRPSPIFQSDKTAKYKRVSGICTVTKHKCSSGITSIPKDTDDGKLQSVGGRSLLSRRLKTETVNFLQQK
jgi:hypothetical protein